MVVRQSSGLHETLSTALGCLFPRRRCILHLQRDCLHSVAMFFNVVGNGITRPDRSSYYKRQIVLANRVARPIFDPRLRSGISETLKSKGGPVKMRRLFGVSDVKLDIIGAFERKKIRFGRGSTFWSSNCR